MGDQVLTHAFNEQTQRLRTDAEATIVNADIDVSLNSVDDSVAIGDTDGNLMEVNPDGSINIENPYILQLSNAIGTGQLVPNKFDKIEVLSKNITGDPLVVRYSQSGSTVATLTIIYDIDGDITSVART
jgi:hypothetical protein